MNVETNEKVLTGWKNDTGCIQINDTCAENMGFQKQTQDCTDGNIDICTDADRNRNQTCNPSCSTTGEVMK